MYRVVWIIVAFALAGCAASSGAAPQDTVSLTPVLVPVSPRVANLEVHIAPRQSMGPARLMVSAAGVTVSPQATVDFALEPLPTPPPVSHAPYPLPPVVIKVFRLVAAAEGIHDLDVSLTWKGGRLEQRVTWNDLGEPKQ